MFYYSLQLIFVDTDVREHCAVVLLDNTHRIVDVDATAGAHWRIFVPWEQLPDFRCAVMNACQTRLTIEWGRIGK